MRPIDHREVSIISRDFYLGTDLITFYECQSKRLYHFATNLLMKRRVKASNYKTSILRDIFLAKPMLKRDSWLDELQQRTSAYQCD